MSTVRMVSPNSLESLMASDFDEIIDVRSPSEFEEDHLPNAINLPVLDDDERATIGTIYVQESRFRARKVGAALVARNAALHLQTYLFDKDGSYRPLVYCWRGGQRSNALATILAQIGWRVSVLEGGYKRYRGLVIKSVYNDPFPAPVFVLDGDTGTGKTEILQHLRNLKKQVIDLEGLAGHRGSFFGSLKSPQPSQRAFEGLLAQKTSGLDPAQPVFVEAESAKIGNRNIPPSLWHAMKTAPRLCLSASVSDRAAYLVDKYDEISRDPVRLEEAIEKLRPYQPTKKIEEWLALNDQGKHKELAEEIIIHHYDPRYRKHRKHLAVSPVEEIYLSSLSPSSLSSAAAQIANLVNS